MKTPSIFAGPALLMCLAFPAWGQGQGSPATVPQVSPAPSVAPASPAASVPAAPPLLGQPVRATEIMGRAIQNLQNEKMGTVEDLAVDLENGRIVEIVVARGGFLGLNQKYVAVPAQNFNAEAGGRILRLNLDKEKLDGAPAVDLSKWSEAMKQSRVEEVYQYFGARPYFLVPEFPPKNAGNPVMHPMKQVERMSQLIHLPTLNYLDENLGKVEDLVVDLPEGRVVEVVIDSARFLGSKDELSPVPPQAFDFKSDGNTLRLDTTASALASAPHFSARAWPQIDREQAGQVYRAWHIVPYFLPIGLTTTQNGGESGNDIVASLDAVQTRADVNITTNIRNGIQNTKDLSENARNVKISTVHGRVTLTGTVVNSQEKRHLGRIAARYAAAGRVDNQLEIKPMATSLSD